MNHPAVRFAMRALLAIGLVLLTTSHPAFADDDCECDDVYDETISDPIWNEEEAANLFALGNLGLSVVTFSSVWNGNGDTGTGLLTMFFGGISAAVGFHNDHSILAASGTMSFVAGLASVAMSLTGKPEPQAAVTAEPFVATITGDTNVGLMARIRY